MILFKEIKKYPTSYIILATGVVITIILFYVFKANYTLLHQRILLYIFAAFYFVWSLYHHSHRGELQLSIIAEYFLIALLAIVIINRF
mgnify:CR=1 FL=1